MEPEYRVYNFKTFVNVTVPIDPCGVIPHGTESQWKKYAKQVYNQYGITTYLYAEFKDEETGFIKIKLIYTLG